MSSKRKRHIKILTFTLAPVVLIGLMVLLPALSLGWDPSTPPTLDNCTGCHDDATVIEGKHTAWEESLHGTGTATAYAGGRNGCAGCHSGGAFSTMVAAGLEPINDGALILGDPNPTRQDCRTCHQVHETGTSADWSLETTAPVVMKTGDTYDGGKGNLCALCHQPRTAAPVIAPGGTFSVTSTHWGPHHGPQSSLLLGVNGAGAAAAGSPSSHYTATGDTCVTCHLGSNDKHGFEPDLNTCKGCHTGATNFDINGKQTLIQGKLDNLKGLLVAAGALDCAVDEEGVEECHPHTGTFPDTTANGLWNYIYLSYEDGSKGAHNVAYATALLDDSITGMGGTP